jgi:hypothetical protein
VVNRLSRPGQALGQRWPGRPLNARAPNALASIKELLSEADHRR